MHQLTLGPRPFNQRKIVQLIARGFFICLLVVPVTLNLPKIIHYAHADLEDCDGDGKDDVTGVAVPWPGYDESHGDTPAGPGTAAWWIAQNGGSTASGSGSSGSGGTAGDSSAGSSAGGSSSKSTAGSSSSKSGGVASAAAHSTTTPSPKAATAAAQPVAGAAAAPAAAASSAVARAPASAASTAAAESTASAESSGVVAASVLNKGGPAGGSTNSLWGALTVGFTSENKELFAGLALLAALALAGGLAVGVSSLRDISAYARLRREELRV
jgi:hypothetical protein